jgi:phosphoglycolate phosphatase
MPNLPIPKAILFDWHGTLVDTHDAMFATVEEVLPQFEELDLVRHLLPENQCRSADDVKLVRYIRIYRHLHPTILAERRISRTDIFNAIFGDNEIAKNIAHKAYNKCYRQYYGEVKLLQEGILDYLDLIKKLGIKVGTATNRIREFLNHELNLVAGGALLKRLDTYKCADDVEHYKPHPDVILAAIDALNLPANKEIWYIGDSQMDMLTARNAGVTSLFINCGQWDKDWIDRMLNQDPAYRPDKVLQNFEALMDLLEQVQSEHQNCFDMSVKQHRPPPFPLPQPPPPRKEADWNPAVVHLQYPEAILFDWHATLVDTLDAMYNAVDDLLPDLPELNLIPRLVPPEKSRSTEDAALVEYIKEFACLHPKVKADRKISRTDIFEVLFGEDEEAKRIVHKRFNHYYRNYFGEVAPFEPMVTKFLTALKNLPIKTGVMTNRDREFFEQELAAVEGTGWAHFFDVNVCGDDTLQRKPNPDPLFKAAEKLKIKPSRRIWYVGDSTTDMVSAAKAGMTAVFYNGAQWDQHWLEKIFPGTTNFPYKPDVVVNDFSEFWALLLACQNK